ncbi:hypothetical protein SAMN05216356_105135 [Oribacterium sp. WCC10]|nr:hypothetical protein SAMN05216356_105135 [Oribacterium sp. WCC10]
MCLPAYTLIFLLNLPPRLASGAGLGLFYSSDRVLICLQI